MYFYRWLKNKNFKQNNYFQGQIFPFLLVCIIVLLFAGIAAKNMGADVKAKTCLDNAADAGALAAGSTQADAFNQLVVMNQEYEDWYTAYRAFYEILYDLATNADDDGYLNQGIQQIKNAYVDVNKALTHVSSHPDCTVWWGFRTADAGTDFKSAAGYARQAAKYFGAFAIIAQYQKQFTDMYKYYQLTRYCEHRDFMNEQYDLSRENAITYAFQNGCSISDVNKLNWWLNSGKYKDDSVNLNNPDSTTWWRWYPSYPQCPGASEIGTRVDVTIPKIKAYVFKQTKKSYPDSSITLKVNISCPAISKTISGDPFKSLSGATLRDSLNAIANKLDALATQSNGAYISTIGAALTCVSGAPPPPPAIDLWPGLQDLANTIQNTTSCIYTALYSFANGFADTSFLSGPRLIGIQNDIWTNVWNTDDSVAPWTSSSCPANISGLPMIIRMEREPDFYLGAMSDKFQVKCTIRTYGKNIYDEKSKTCTPYYESKRLSKVTFQNDGVLGDQSESKDLFYPEIFSTN